MIIATFGSDEWNRRGNFLAEEILKTQTIQPAMTRIHHRTGTLTQARNEGGIMANEWLVFLDADDDLDPHFVEALDAYEGDADILQTSVRGFYLNLCSGTKHWIEPEPVFHPKRYPLTQQNYLVIGSPIRTDRFMQVGGFDPWPVLEDWALWLKCYKHGAIFDELPGAVYEINDHHQRNKHLEIDSIARQIRETYR